MIHPELRSCLRSTTMLSPERLRGYLGVDLVLASETFQHTGSFKFRAAMNVALSVPQKRVITASSGNFGQAMAYACRLTGKSCVVVMPDTSARVKVEAVREFGAETDLIDVGVVSRAARVSQLAEQYEGSYVASAYDDDLVIAGNSTLGEELSQLNRVPDVIIAPVGGGGLTAGLIRGAEGSIEGPGRSGLLPPSIVGAEPLLANDAARSLRAGALLANETEPQTIADGTRTVSLGTRNWDVLKRGLGGIVEVEEEKIGEAVHMLFVLANLKVEPTGALGLAAILTEPERFSGMRVCCVISGGNVDAAVYAKLIG